MRTVFASSSLVATRWARISISFARSALAIAAAALLVLYVCLISFSPLPPPPAASTNHEGEIVQIAARVKSLNPQPQALADLAAADPQGVAAPELRELYQKLETLLEADNAIIIREPDCTNAYFDSASMDRIQTCRHLGRALQAEIKSLAAASNYQRAAQRARANLRLGLMFGRGGLYLDMLVGQSIISTHTLADVAHFRD